MFRPVRSTAARLLRRLAVPAGTGFFFTTMFNVVDTFYGGLISTKALAALSLWAYHFPKIGVDYMPPLDEGSILDMPVTVPRHARRRIVDASPRRRACSASAARKLDRSSAPASSRGRPGPGSGTRVTVCAATA